MDTFDPEVLRNLETMEHSEARTICLNLINKSKTRANRKAALIRDIEVAPSSKELSRIMWNVMLAGEGLPVSNSLWQQTYGK